MTSVIVMVLEFTLLLKTLYRYAAEDSLQGDQGSML
jgi:hypothetical protein